MNVNLDNRAIEKYRHGAIIGKLYRFSLQWWQVSKLNHPYIIHKDEVERLKAKIENGERVEPIIILKGFGIVAGVHLLEAFQSLKYDKIPVIYGTLKRL